MRLSLKKLSHRTLVVAVQACLFIATSSSVSAASAQWGVDGSGSWTVGPNWIGGVIADGADNTADFNGAVITSGQTVTLDGNRTIGNVIFDGPNSWALDTGSGGTLTLAVSSGSPTITANGGIHTVNAVLSGTGGMTKNGNGTLALTAANTYTGATTINASTLALIGGGSIFNTATITVASGAILDASGRTDGTLSLVGGQTLRGNGSVFGLVTVAAGATLSPAINGIGTLTMNSNLTCAGVVRIDINRLSFPNSDLVGGISTCNYGGTLTVTNLGSTLQAGDCFTLFAASNYIGSFTAMNLPALGAGLVWDTSNLNQNGSICVRYLPPVFVNCPASTNLGCNPLSIPECDPGVEATNYCGIPTVTCAMEDLTNGCARTRTITYTATDACGTSNTCTQVINWTVDALVFTPPLVPDITVPCGNGWHHQLPTVTSACCSNPSVILINSITNGAGCSQFVTNTLQVTDCCGNTNIYNQTVQTDTAVTPPVTTATPGSTVQFGSSVVNATNYQWFFLSSEFGGWVPINLTWPTNPIVDITNIWRFSDGIYSVYATDSSGVVVAQQFVLQVTPCLISLQCPLNTVVQACTNVAVTYSTTAYDSCVGSIPVTFNPPSGSLFPIGTTPVSCTATDMFGFSTNCIFTVTVVCVDTPCCTSSTWTLVPMTNHPSARSEHALAYDTARGVAVFFGGYNTGGTPLGDTWLWDGFKWTQVFPANSPSPRWGHSMAYDEVRQVVVLYGGVSASNPNGETWEWNGVNWTQRIAWFGSPGARYRHSMAFDPINNRVMLIGGNNGATQKGDTWEWTGNTWLQVVAEGNGLSARDQAAVATDSVRQRVVIHGGYNGLTTPLSDTLEWNGSSWITVNSGGPGTPGPRQDHALAYSPACGGVILFGGSALSYQSPPLGDTWLWDGSSWTLRTANGPAPRRHLKLATDPQNSRIILFGGSGATNSTGATWGWGCDCVDVQAPVDQNGNVLFPAGTDMSSIVYEDVDMIDGYLDELYPEFDTLQATFYDQIPCPLSFGNNGVTNVDYDLAAELAGLGITNVTPEEISLVLSNFAAQIGMIESNDPPNFSSLPPLTTNAYTLPAKPRCVDPTEHYVFGGRDIVFVHGIRMNPLVEKMFLASGGAHTEWPQDKQEFYGVGYWKTGAEAYWAAHIQKFLTSRGIKNRFLIVAYPATQRLGIGAQAILTQIADAMQSGIGVVDPVSNDTTAFGAPSFVVVSHSMGAEVTDIAMTMAAENPNLGVEFIPRQCKAHIAMRGAFAGSSYATAVIALSGYLTVNPPPIPGWLCPLVNVIIRVLDETGNTNPQLNCPINLSISVLATSSLVDLIPAVAQWKWGSYINNSPVRTLTLVGGHATFLTPLKHLLSLGYDDGVVTINSQLANPNSFLFWPSGVDANLNLFTIGESFDLGLALRPIPDPENLNAPHRAIEYFVDRNIDRFLNPISLIVHPTLMAAGATPYVSPSGMVQNNVSQFNLTGGFNPLRRSNNHFSFLQSAGDHFAEITPFVGAGVYDGDYQRTLIGDERNWEEVLVITDVAAVFQPFSMVYPGDDQPLLTRQCTPRSERQTVGRKVSFKLFGKKYVWWIWKRTYDRLAGSKLAVCDVDYMYNSVLCNPANQCPTCVPPPADLALWLPFDEASGTSAHNLAAGYNGTLYDNGVVASGGNGPIHTIDYNARSLFFDGTNDWVEVPSYDRINVHTNDFTLDAWVKRDPSSGNIVRVIVDKRDTTTGIGYSFAVSFGHLILTLTDGSGAVNYVDTATVPLDGLWHFVAVTVQRTSQQGVRFYVDGNPTAVLDPTASSGSLSNAAPLRVGKSAVGGNLPWMGCIDEVELFRRALTPVEIRSLLTAKWAGKCKFSCSVPQVSTLCTGRNSITNTAHIYNNSSSPQTFNYSFQNCSGSSLGFSPASGTVLLQPGQTANIPVIITVLNGCCSFCFKLTAIGQESGATISSTGTVQMGDYACDDGWPDSGGNVRLNVGSLVSLPTFRLTNPSSTNRLYNYRFVVMDQAGLLDATHVSLNGLPPGTPVTGNTTLPPGGSTNISLTAQFVLPDPLGIYNVVFQLDTSGNGTWESLYSIGLQNVSVPSENPLLEIAVSGNNIILNWNADGICHLQSTTQLNSNSNVWINVPGLPPVSLPISSGNQFFRLSCP